MNLLKALVLFAWIVGSAMSFDLLAADPVIAFKEQPGQVEILVGEQTVATYYYRDDKTTRPYFAHLRVLGGTQVTRNHPPVEGKDEMDHAPLHPGLWLAFGDLSKADGWRNKAKVTHDGFVEPPQGGVGSGSFAVRNRYYSTEGQEVICSEICRYRFKTRPTGLLIEWDSTFQSPDRDFVFGDQEEMGLGVRVATSISAKKGGEITISTGEKNEKQVRGKAAAWCDYSGVLDGRHVGITLMPHPGNFRPCWYHARDYGFVAANPFGRKSLTKGRSVKSSSRKGRVFDCDLASCSMPPRRISQRTSRKRSTITSASLNDECSQPTKQVKSW